MTWLARLKKTAVSPEPIPAKPTKPGFAGFAGTPAALSQNSDGDTKAANDPAHVQDFDPEAFEERAGIAQFDGGLSRPDAEALAAQGMAFDPDQHCWPNTNAMNTAEIDTFMSRVHLFTKLGISLAEAESTADSLVKRDRQKDDRRLCLECAHLRHSTGAWRCGQWKAADAPHPELSSQWSKQPQRCGAFKESSK